MMAWLAEDALRREFTEAVQARKVCHPSRYHYFTQVINSTLEKYHDWSQRATNWDACQWGFHDDQMLQNVLRQLPPMARHEYWPTEPQMRFPDEQE